MESFTFCNRQNCDIVCTVLDQFCGCRAVQRDRGGAVICRTDEIELIVQRFRPVVLGVDIVEDPAVIAVKFIERDDLPILILLALRRCECLHAAVCLQDVVAVLIHRVDDVMVVDVDLGGNAGKLNAETSTLNKN